MGDGPGHAQAGLVQGGLYVVHLKAGGLLADRVVVDELGPHLAGLLAPPHQDQVDVLADAGLAEGGGVGAQGEAAGVLDGLEDLVPVVGAQAVAHDLAHFDSSQFQLGEHFIFGVSTFTSSSSHVSRPQW